MAAWVLWFQGFCFVFEWLTIVCIGGRTINKFSVIIWTKFFYLQVYTGFQSVGGLMFQNSLSFARNKDITDHQEFISIIVLYIREWWLIVWLPAPPSLNKSCLIITSLWKKGNVKVSNHCLYRNTCSETRVRLWYMYSYKSELKY